MNEAVMADSHEKHIELHEAIQNIDGIARHLDELIERMEGPTPKDGAVESGKEERPRFIDVLNGGPGSIREKTDAAHKRIERLMEMLF